MEIDYCREASYPVPLVNSALFPLLLISLAGQRHTPKTKPPGRHRCYDYIVVGAGTAGSVVASRMSENPCLSILLLEAGKQPPLMTEIPVVGRLFVKSDMDWNYTTVPLKHTARQQTNRQVIFPCGKAIGGSSVINPMMYFRGNPQDYDNWEKGGATSWGYKKVFPYFIRAEDNQDPDIACNGYHGVGGPMTVKRFPTESQFLKPARRAQERLGYSVVDANAENQIGIIDLQGTIRDGQRCSAAKAYLVPAENRTNLRIVEGALVTKILINRNRKRAYGVTFIYNGKRHVAFARKEVIVSAGTINTAQLLMLSGIGPRSELKKLKIPVIANLPVGRNLQDHCGVILPFVASDRFPTLLEKLQDDRNIKKYIKKRCGILASSEGVFSMFYGKREDSCSPPGQPDYMLYMVEGAIEYFTLQFGLTEKAYNQYLGPYENQTTVWCVPQTMRQRIPGCVTLRSSNIHDAPVIDPNYYAHPEDMEDIKAGLKKCHEIYRMPEMRRLGIKPLKTSYPCCEGIEDEMEQYECLARSQVLAYTHHVGTAKMGHCKDKTAVVDPKLRVIGIERLRVVDASVMPSVPSGHSDNPVVMIAEKASDMIKEDISCC